MTLDRFYPIWDGAEWFERLLPLGVRLVQIRLKDMEDRLLRREIRAARDLCAAYGAQLVVNDHWQIAIDEGCDYVHLGQEDLDTADLPAIRRAGLRLGVSTHDHAELDRALSCRPDYVALGPIYPTVLKAMRFAPQGLERIAAWKQRIAGLPLVAIGGFTVARAAGAFDAGADVVSVVTDITRHPDPDARCREWIDATRTEGISP